MDRHSTDVASLIAGVVFVAAGALLLAGRLDLVTHARWVVPLMLIAVALGLLVSASAGLGGGRHADRPAPQGARDEAAAASPPPESDAGD